MYVLPKIDSEPFEVFLLLIFTFFENENISLISIYEDPSSEKIFRKLFEIIERNV